MLLPRSTFALSALFAATLLMPAMMPTAAQAALADDDLYCWIVGGGDDVDCDTAGNIRAQCKGMGAKPGEVEECDDVRNMLVVPMGLTGSGDGGGTHGGGSHTPGGLGLTGNGGPRVN